RVALSPNIGGYPMLRTLVLGTVAAAVGILLLLLFDVSPTGSAPAESVVKISTNGGHGSGFQVGDGYIFTAAHVVNKASSVTVKSTTGEEQEAEVLWTNPAYDVALVRVPDAGRIESALLACRAPHAGEEILAKGNPGPQEFISVWGRIGAG